MSARTKNSKEEKQRSVSKAILEVIEKDGLVGITHSKVARKSGVSRAWIYEYVGKAKNDLVEFGAEAFALEFSRAKLALPKTREDLDRQLREGVGFVFNSAVLEPVVIQLYFRFRGTDNSVGNVIKKYETQWLRGAQQIASDILGLPATQATMLAEVILTLRLGFAHRVGTSKKPRDSRESAERVFDYFHDLLGNSF